MKEGQPVTEKPFFGPTQVQSVNELHTRWYIYHHLGKGPRGETIEVGYSLKIIGVAQDGVNALIQWRGVDGEPYTNLSLYKLGIVQSVRGEWYSGGWLEDPSKNTK